MNALIVRLLVSLLLIVSGARAEKLSNGDEVGVFIHQNIQRNDVMVFAKSYCPFCRKTRQLLESLHQAHPGWSLQILDLDKMPNEEGPMVQGELLALTQQRTVPNVFIGGEHIGGNSELQHLHSDGNLVGMLEELTGRDEV